MHPATIPIHFYQRYISPYKGYKCCYSIIHDSCSCSQYGKRAIERNGLVAGVKLLRRRLRKCGLAYQAALQGAHDEALKRKKVRVRRKKKNDDGEDMVDCLVMPCHLPDFGCSGGDAVSGAGDAAGEAARTVAEGAGEVASTAADAVAGAADVGSMCECGGCDISI